MRFKSAVLTLSVCALLAVFSGAAEAQTGFVQIDVPGSLSTTATGINNLAQIVGWYITANSSGTGFEYNDGSFINLNIAVPGALFTQPLAINDTGAIVGVFGGASGPEGFVLNALGYSPITGPAGSVSDEVTGIDNAGDVAGWYVNGSQITQGFIANGSTGQFTTINAPGATATEITGINSAGGVVAGIADVLVGPPGSVPVETGFLYDYGATSPAWVQFNLPFTTAIDSVSVNDSGEIACTYTDLSGLSHGCLSNGVTFSTVDDPNGIGTTVLSGINDGGQFVGSYMDANGVTHGITTPEPSALILWISGLGAVGIACWRSSKLRLGTN